MLTEPIIDLIFLLLGLATALFLFWFSLVSLKEQERRAAGISASLGALIFILFKLAKYLAYEYKLAIIYTLVGLLLIFLILFFLPIGKLPPDEHKPTKRFDERDILFARHRLEPGTELYDNYYTRHPENKQVDDRNRARPGLLSPESKYALPTAFAATEASFQITESLHSLAEGSPSEKQHQLSPEEATHYLKSQTLFFGANDVGITRLEPYHIYSHIGRGPGISGTPIKLDHTYALAFTVEMDHNTIQAAPLGATVMESAHQYVEAGKIAVQLAAAIRALGYEARAHIDGNYRVICPSVARDAGLGEVGRISLLMTPRLGPRVRIGVVTTDLPLIPDPIGGDPSIIDFCKICKKCADNCPSSSISFDSRVEEDGTTRWKLNPGTCFAYWNEAGTDCGICLSVCPYAHPDNLAHNLIRWGNQRSGFFRRVALKLDDLFYGRNPKRQPNPDWLGGGNNGD